MPYPGFHKNRDVAQDAQPEPIRRSKKEETAGKTETFVSRNVKLLTFLACMTVIALIMVGFGVYRAQHYGDDAQEADGLMSVEQMETLVDKGAKLAWKDFDGYAYEVVGEDIVYVRCYDVEGGEYCFMVTSEAKGTSIISVIWVDFISGEQTEIFAPEKVQ